LRVGRWVTTPHHGNKASYFEMLHKASEFLACPCEDDNEPLGSVKFGKLD